MSVQTQFRRRFPVRTRSSSTKQKSRIVVAAAVGALGFQLFPMLGIGDRRADAATYTWDPTLAPTNPLGGPGTWNLTTANWSNGSTDGLWTDTSSTGTDTAVFDGTTGGLVTLNTNLSAASLVIDIAAYKINSANKTLTLGSGGINALSIGSGTSTLSAAIALSANQFWNVGNGGNLLDSSPISGTGFGIGLLGTGTLKLTAAESYTGATTVDNGTLILNFGAAGAPNNNILATSSTLALGGGTFQVNTSSSSVTTTQTFAGTSLNAAESFINFNNTGSTIPLLNLGAITSNGSGQAIEIEAGPATIGAGNVLVPATATLTATKIGGQTPTASTIVAFPTTGISNSGVGGGDFATVGLYDYAAIDPTGTFVEGGSQITGFYKTYAATGTQTVITANSNADITGSFPTKNAAGTNPDTPASLRFNTAGAITVTVNGSVETGGILVTPNVAANNITITGTAQGLASSQSTAVATELVAYQNNTLGFLNIATGLGASTVSGNVYTQAGPGTVLLGTATNLSAYTGLTYLDGGTTEIAADGDLGPETSGATPTLFLQGGSILASNNFTMDGGTTASARPINVMFQGGSIAAVAGDTLTVDGAITGNGVLDIGIGTLTGTGSGTANTTAVTGKGTVILSGGAANTYSGGTIVHNGTLRVDGVTSNTGTGTVAVNANAFLVGTGAIATVVTSKANSHIAPGDNGIGTLSVAGLTLNSNSDLDLEFATSPSPSNDLINITGTNGLSFGALANGPADINLFQVGTNTAFDAAGTYNLMQISGGTTIPLATLQADLAIGNPLPSNVATYTIGLSGNDITLTINSVSINATWNNTGSGNWSNATADQTATDTNWTGGVAPFQAGDIANFLTTPGITSPSTIDLNISETVGTINFNNTASYTIATNEGSTLTLDSGSSGAASIVDSGGTHTLAVPLTLNKAASITVVNSTDSLVISGAIAGSTALSINPSPTNGQGTVILADPNGNAAYSGQPSVNSGTLQIGTGGPTGGFGTYTGTVTVNGTLAYDLSGTVTLSNKIVGTGSLTQIGTGVLNVAKADTMSYTNILNGTLQLGVAGALGNSTVDIASPGILDLNGKSPTLNAFAGNGTIDNVSAGGVVVLTIGNAGLSTNNNTFSGSIKNTTGTVGLLQAGSGTLTLSGASTYSGGTAITAGVIKAASNSALGTGTVVINTAVYYGLQLANGVTLSNPIVPNTGNNVNGWEDVPDPGASATLSGPITTTKDFRLGTSQTTSTLNLTGTIAVGSSGTGSVLSRGNIVFSGNANFTNNASTIPLIVGRYNSTSTLYTLLTDNAIITTNSGVELGGAGGTTDDASTTLTLSGSSVLNTGAGSVNLNANSMSGGNVTLNLGGSSTLATSGFTFSSLAGPTTAVNLSGGTIVANGNDPVSSQFLPNISAGLSNGSLTINVLNGGGTINNNGFNITVAQALQDGEGVSDTMNFVGTGSTTLTNGGNTYAGNTTVGDGVNPTTLVVSNAGGSATGPGNVNLNSGTLASGAAGAISGNVLVGSSAVTIAPGGIGSIGTLAVGGLTTSSLSMISFDLGSGAGPEISNGDLLILGSGTVSIASNTPLSIAGSPVSGDDYRLIGDTSSGTVVDAILLNSFALPMAPAGLTYMLSNSVDAGYIDLVVGSAVTGPANLVWNNTGGAAPSDGQTWDIGTNNNWNNGTATTVYTDGSNVTFNDSNGGPASYTVSLTASVHPASVTVNTSGTYLIGGSGSIGGTGGLTKSGFGTLVLSTPNTYSGGTTVNDGALIIEPTSSTTSALPAGTLTINDRALVQIATNVTAGSNVGGPPPVSNVKITSLSMAVNATLDITNNHIIINYGSNADPISSIVNLITTGYNGGTWNGRGIISTTAQSNPSYGIGYADYADPGNPAGLASGEIEIAYTLLGDANLDGKVNGTDFILMATNFNDAVTNGWDEGDFNYSGTVNGSDFLLLAENFNQFASQSAIAGADYSVLSAFNSANGLSLASVPEPASTALLTVGVVSALSRRRRRSNR